MRDSNGTSHCYSSDANGNSVDTFLSMCGGFAEKIMVVHDGPYIIWGGFTTEPWGAGGCYHGGSSCWLFALAPEMIKSGTSSDTSQGPWKRPPRTGVNVIAADEAQQWETTTVVQICTAAHPWSRCNAIQTATFTYFGENPQVCRDQYHIAGVPTQDIILARVVLSSTLHQVDVVEVYRKGRVRRLCTSRDVQTLHPCTPQQR